MAKKDTKKSLKDKVLDAALALAAEQGWSEVSFEEIVAAADVDLKEAYEYFDDKTDILTAYGRRIDQQVLESFFDNDPDLSAREKLFDLMMERFDVHNENREAVLSILNSFKGDPKQAVVGFPHLTKSMARVLEAAGVDTEGVCGAAKVAGLVGVDLYTARVWKDDDSPDMAKTMAALDKALDYAEQAANSFDDGLLSGVSDFCKSFVRKDSVS